MLMRKDFKKYFVAIWVFSLLLFCAELFLVFANYWMLKSVSYLYVASVIFLFINPASFSEKVLLEDHLIKFKGYDIWGVLFIISGITALLLFAGFKSSVLFVLAIVTLAISVWIIIKYRSQITKRLFLNGIIVGFLCALAQYNYWPSLLVIFVTAPAYYIAASLLNARFHFTVIRFNNGSYRQIVKSFFIGCILALPMAFSNLNDVMTTQPFDWIKEFWQPMLAFNFVLIEEMWVRLFIMTLIFALLVPKTQKKIIPAIAAILISAIIFGSTHYPRVDIQNCIHISLLYGLPLGVLLYKRDFETVIGYHFIINFISAVSAYYVNSGA